MKSLTAILATFLIAFSQIAMACSCPVYKNLENFQLSELSNAECIIIGEVLSISPEKNSFQVKVIESLKGTEKGIIYEGTYDAQCGPVVKEEGKWLIYGFVNTSGILEVNECGLSRSFENPIHDFISYELNQTERLNKAKLDLKKEIELVRLKL